MSQKTSKNLQKKSRSKTETVSLGDRSTSKANAFRAEKTSSVLRLGRLEKIGKDFFQLEEKTWAFESLDIKL